jgi:hypothetical protein
VDWLDEIAALLTVPEFRHWRVSWKVHFLLPILANASWRTVVYHLAHEQQLQPPLSQQQVVVHHLQSPRIQTAWEVGGCSFDEHTTALERVASDPVVGEV